MEASIFAFVRRYSTRQQLYILAMSLASLPILYMTLDLPKTIINEALSGDGPYTVFGFELTQIGYLYTLCGFFLALVLVGGVLKYVTNVYIGVVAERMLRRLRYQLYQQVMRFPLPHLRRVSQGELVQLINAETEPLGGFVGDALSMPAIQGGTLLTTLFFMFMQDWVLGISAVALYPFQLWLIPKLQAQVNQLGKLRVRQVRRNAERISEMAQSVRDIRANDATWWERARFSEELGQVYDIRFKVYKKKFLIKFLNNFIAQLGPFFFFSIGGYLVLQGQITIGALVAVVAAQKDMASPWKELLTYYQNLYDVKIKYDQTIIQFLPPGLRDPKLQDEQPESVPPLQREMRGSGIVVRDDDDEPLIDGISFTLPLPSTVGIIGPSGSGKEELTLVMAGLMQPNAGRITVDGQDLSVLPEAVLGRRIAYVASPAAIFSGTIADNLLYGLRHRPVAELSPEIATSRARYRLEAEKSGNAPFEPLADWTDWAAAGLVDPEERLIGLVRVLRMARLDSDVYSMGLRFSISPEGDLATALLDARRAMHERLAADQRLARLVEPFDPDRYNTNASLAENLLFGAPIGGDFDLERLAANPYVREILDRTGLTEELVQVGWRLAQTMVELFADLPPDHEYFQQFSFIAPEDLPYYRTILSRYDQGRLGELPDVDRDRLLSLAFKLSPARHRLGLLSDELLAKVLDARHDFRANLPPHLAGSIAFFDPESYNAASSIQDNMLFGKIAYGQAQAVPRIAALLSEVLEAHGLRERIVEIGLGAECGMAGSRLSLPQRQKLAIARALLKRADILILHDATVALDAAEQVAIRDAVLSDSTGRSVIWAFQNDEWASQFEHVLALEGGRATLRRNTDPVQSRESEDERPLEPAS